MHFTHQAKCILQASHISKVQSDFATKIFKPFIAHSSPNCPPGSADHSRPLASAEIADSNHKFPHHTNTVIHHGYKFITISYLMNIDTTCRYYYFSIIYHCK
jgi:hypothetical protein